MPKYQFYEKALLMLDQDGNEHKGFAAFIRNMEMAGYARNSIKTYASYVARFINYVEIATKISPPKDLDELRQVFTSYKHYLLQGVADTGLGGRVAKITGRVKKLKPYSLVPIEAAISRYVRLGEAIQEAHDNVPVVALFGEHIKKLSHHEKQAIRTNSWLGGMMPVKALKTRGCSISVLGRTKGNGKKLSYQQSFPLEYSVALIDAAKSNRDKALYSFLAASGARSHEALQITLDDIDVANGTVRLVNPFAAKDDRLSALDPDEAECLAWKGRSTEKTFLISPYKEMFFTHLKNYIDNERVNDCNHRFIFQISTTTRPLFTSDRSSRIKTFKSAATRAGMDDLFGISPHSLRHMYGVYVLNYLPPMKDGYRPGMPMSIVKVLMGHANITSTEVYAKHDEDMLEADILYANQRIFDENLTIDDVRIKYIDSRLAAIQAGKEKMNDKEAA
ncbi:integrase [Ferrimonas sediminicola]|uniref:Integrase n=1 Tax=Ferrimonas sediminicola TaxID=2569538 RepID=A0A4U1B934_9GAMM|nr:site-specific integrase [Ferrimonas sediminicola]TKB46502.1 integrase [Ferrimonas sediminicola]